MSCTPRCLDALLASEVTHGVAVRILRQAIEGTLIYHLAPQPASRGADVDEVISGTDNLLIMLHHDDGVTLRLQLSEYTDELIRIVRMEADAGFVEDVERPDEAAAQRGGQADALTLAAGEGGGEAVEGEVAEANVE